MATYIILNAVFLALVIIPLLVLKRFRWNTSMTVTVAVILITTAVFDSLLISAGMFYYEPSKILGIHVGQAPIEDFFYAVLAVIVVPTVWNSLGRKHNGHN